MVYNGDGQMDCKCGTKPFSRALGKDLSAMQCHEMPGNGESQAQTSMVSRHGAVGLTESIEHIGQEFRRDSLAGVGHTDLNVRINSLKEYLNAPLSWGEFDG